MIGGLKKTTSRFVIAAAAGLFMGGLAFAPANAADLGGDCCADLEERVAELEATTVRKGNRKVSLKLSGHVNKMVMFWDDAVNTDFYVVDNDESETRFRLTGSTGILPGWSAGFIIEAEAESASSDTVDARSDGDNDDGSISQRRASLYIKSDQIGKFTLGHDSPATDSLIGLNIASNPIADSDPEWGTGFHLVRPNGTNSLPLAGTISTGCQGAGCRTGIRLNHLAPSLDTRRGDVLRYDSPSLFGLVVSAAWGEDDLADVAVRFKKEWNSVRMVAGMGYLWDTDENESAAGGLGNTALINCPAGANLNGTASNCVSERFDVERILMSGSTMHTPTGLYAHAAYVYQRHGDTENQPHLAANTNIGAATSMEAPDASMWYLQAGLKRRLLMPNAGATTFYGEVQQFDDFGVTSDAGSLFGITQGECTAPGGNVFAACSEITDTSVTMIGFGVVQDIDPAAMKLYAGVRYWDPEVRAQALEADGSNFFNNQGADVSLEEFWSVGMGAKINF